ncbi:MAG: hypothetical protein BGN86_12760 [Caulobacterales bacterium 68-7]|nr:DUF484 family protein [Caulobacterales bacterium]OJU12486.1 MAG: hypothetical protein BGN86_12760 [Caulobacterales bacterium 68-7]
MTPASIRSDGRLHDLDHLREQLRDNPSIVRDDPDLLRALGLRIDAANVVDFGPAALARVAEEARRESTARQSLEDTARANFAAQAQTHAAVVELLDARNHSDLARRVDHIASHRFGLLGAVVALEGPDRVPAGWRTLVEGQIDLILGEGRDARMGPAPTAIGLFGARSGEVRSMAMARMGIGAPERGALIAFASDVEDGFTPDMGPELISFLARVIERTAERWPILA